MSLRDVRKARSAYSGGGGRRKYVQDIRMEDGDVIRGFFLAEPTVFLMHKCTQVGRRKFSFERCAKADSDDSTPCGWCSANVQGDVRVNRASPRALMSFQPTTLFHMIPATDKRTGRPITTKNGDPIVNERPCKGKTCKMCKSGDEPQKVGVRRFEIASMFAEALLSRVDDISQFAVEGWTADEDGRVLVERIGWACAECGAKFKEVGYTTEQFQDGEAKKCSKCGHEAPFVERLKAEGIENPTRCGLLSGEWKIARFGKDKGVSYAFDFLKVATPPEAAFEEMIDYDEQYPVQSVKRVEELLGTGRSGRPLARGGGSQSYDENSGGDDDDEGAEDDEPEVRSLRAPSPRPAAVKRGGSIRY